MVIPVGIMRPEVILRNKSFQAAFERHGRAWAGFSVESECAAVFICVGQPIAWWNIIVGSGHLDAGFASDDRGLLRGGRKVRVRPVIVFQNPDVGGLHVGRRWPIAAVQPDEHAGMTAHTQNLRAKGRGGDFEIPRLPLLP